MDPTEILENPEQAIDTAARFLHAETWVIEIFAIVFAALLLDFVIRRVLNRLQKQLAATENPWDDVVLHAMRRPLTVLIWVMGLALAAEIARRQSDSSVLDYVAPVREVAVIAIVAWFLVRLIRRGEETIIERHQASGEPFDRTTLDAVAKLLRLSVIITTMLVILQTMGFSISGVLAAGGVGGIAIGFAAKDLLANFFGGLMIYLDRPFAVGDWIRSPDRDIEGTVENIGWRRTVIRTFDKRPLYVPNATFTTIAVENPSRMRNRRIKETVGVRYDDLAEVPGIVEDVKAMLKAHPDIDTTQTLIVNFDAFNASSLDFFVYTFTKTTNWIRFHEVKQDVMLKIADIIGAHGAEIAYPTSTLHLASMPAAEPEPVDSAGAGA